MASIIYGHNGTLAFLSSCIVCRQSIAIEDVPEEGYAQWKMGRNIQDALPSLTDDEREFLISQVCGPCFNDNVPTGE